MARDIDLDNLDDDDRQYIKDRPWLVGEIVLQGGDPDDLGVNPDTAPDDPRTIYRTPSLESSLVDGTQGPDVSAEYDKLNKQQLQAEIDRRNEQLEEGEEPLDRTGTVTVLRQRLMEHDEATEDDDDEDDESSE